MILAASELLRRGYCWTTMNRIKNPAGSPAENLHGYAIAVHGIKGSSRGICAEAIGTKAEALEKAAKEGNLDFVKANNGGLIKDLENFIGVLRNVFAKLDAGNSKPKKDKPENGLLLNLLAACKAYNMNAVDTAMKEIEQYKYEDGLALWLRENVDQMNYSEIAEKLSALKM